MRVLVTAATRAGATEEIARAIGDELTKHGIDAAVVRPEEVGSIEEYDGVVIGSAVYGGHWLESAKEFVSRRQDALAKRPVWLFSSGPVGDPRRKLVQKMNEDPVDVPELIKLTGARGHRVFTGKLEKKNLSLRQKVSLLTIRDPDGDFRNWREIESWAAEIGGTLAAGS